MPGSRVYNSTHVSHTHTHILTHTHDILQDSNGRELISFFALYVHCVCMYMYVDIVYVDKCQAP